MKTHDVFGIKPTVSESSYIDRGSLDLQFKKLVERKQTHIAIRGASKAGKSWLRQRVLIDPIIVQCRISYTTLDIFKDALARLDISVELEQTKTKTIKGQIGASGEAGFKLLAKVAGNAEVAAEHQTSTKGQLIGKNINDLEFIASVIKASGRTLVIEDFHYLPLSEQQSFAFDLKTLWDYQTFVVVVGVWISENMLTTLNPDLSDRIEELSVTWSPEDLKRVLIKGCAELRLEPSHQVADELARISYESVGLIQKLALRYISDELGIDEAMTPEAVASANAEVATKLTVNAGITAEEAKKVKEHPYFALNNLPSINDAAMHVAEQLNPLYQAFAKRVCDGIRTRQNSTGIYAHAMAAIMTVSDDDLSTGILAKKVFDIAHARQPRIQFGNLKTVLARFPELQVDAQGRGLVLAYDPSGEKLSVVDRQLLLYRQFATVKWPWEDLIDEVSTLDDAFNCGTVNFADQFLI